MSFQENLRRCREAAGFSSARAFAESIGIPYTTYISYENKDREPKYETLCRIADALDVTTDELLGVDRYVFWKDWIESAGYTVIEDKEGTGITITCNLPSFYGIQVHFNSKDFLVFCIDHTLFRSEIMVDVIDSAMFNEYAAQNIPDKLLPNGSLDVEATRSFRESIRQKMFLDRMKQFSKGPASRGTGKESTDASNPPTGKESK